MILLEFCYTFCLRFHPRVRLLKVVLQEAAQDALGLEDLVGGDELVLLLREVEAERIERVRVVRELGGAECPIMALSGEISCRCFEGCQKYSRHPLKRRMKFIL